MTKIENMMWNAWKDPCKFQWTLILCHGGDLWIWTYKGIIEWEHDKHNWMGHDKNIQDDMDMMTLRHLYA